MFKFDETLMLLVKKDLENGNIPMLLGEPGIGKSSWVEALARTMNTKCFTLACNQLADKADLTGARLVPCGQDANGDTQYAQKFYPHSIIHEACDYAEKNPREHPILFLDELNRTTPDVTSEALSIPTMRKIGNTSLPANLRIVTAGNDKGNITSLDDASVTRFVLYSVEPDKDTFIQVNPELNEFIKRVLNAHPEVLFCRTLTVSVKKDPSGADDDPDNIMDAIIDEGDEMVQTTTPRTLTGLSKWLNSFTNDELKRFLFTETIADKNDPTQQVSVLGAAIESHVGRTNFSQLLIQEIMNSINTVQNQTNVPTIQKPQCYDLIKSQPDMNSLNQVVMTLAKNELAAMAAYMLTEPVDNRAFLTSIMPLIEQTDIAPYFPILMSLAPAGKLDSDNMQAAISSANQMVTASLNILTMY